jgi:dolichol kinase
MRSHEGRRPTGTFYASLGILGSIAFFGAHPSVVTASILYLALGDAASALAGKAWGKRRFTLWGRTRSVEGTLAGFAAALGAGALAGLPPGMALAGAAFFSLVDALPVPPDDNLWIPLLTAAFLYTIGLR